MSVSDAGEKRDCSERRFFAIVGVARVSGSRSGCSWRAWGETRAGIAGLVWFECRNVSTDEECAQSESWRDEARQILSPSHCSDSEGEMHAWVPR